MTGKRPAAVMTNQGGSEFGAIISAARARKGMTQSELARRLGVSVSAVGNWEAGLRRPDLNIVPALCQTLGITLGALFGIAPRTDEVSLEARAMLRGYKALTPDNRRIVDRMVDSLLDMQREALRARIVDIRCVMRSDLKACAGLGNALDDARGEAVYIHTGTRADEIITITGDSMEPTFHNGDEVLVAHCETLRPGEIGIFVADGDGYIKEYQGSELRSHNPAYAPMPLADFDSVRCIGRVVGRLSPDAYATDEEIELLTEQANA